MSVRADDISYCPIDNSSVPKNADVKKIDEAAEFASEKTGVRKDFLMGMMVTESSLGQNPGQCTYQEVERGAEIAHQKGQLSDRAWGTFLDRRETIKQLASDLGYSYENLKVSCNPDGVYYGTGGAMGVGQFMPDTWLEYKDRTSAIVGKEHPDPWNEKDGAVAMALKLSDVYGVTSHNLQSEKNAAKIYLSGNTSYQYNWYANRVIYWANNYQKLLA